MLLTFFFSLYLKDQGNPYVIAPELLRGESAPTRATDVYAFGILLGEGELKFSNMCLEFLVGLKNK